VKQKMKSASTESNANHMQLSTEAVKKYSQRFGLEERKRNTKVNSLFPFSNESSFTVMLKQQEQKARGDKTTQN